MKEQSHKNEMSAAIRGDFQRLRDRGVAATLAPRDDEDVPEPAEILSEHEEPAVVPEPDPVAELVPEHEEPAVSEVVPEHEEPAVVPEPDPVAELVPEPEEPALSAVATAPREPGAEPRAGEVDEPAGAERQGFLSRLFGR